MLEHIVIIVSVVFVVGGAGLAWWYENGPEKKGRTDSGEEVKDK